MSVVFDLPAEGSSEAAVECQQTLSSHYVQSHPDHPHLHFLLCLQVHLETQESFPVYKNSNI